MNRQFTIPVAVALGFHAFLFLGFSKPQVSPPRPKNTDTEPPCSIKVTMPDLEIIDEGGESEPPGQKAEVSAPQLPENIPISVPVDMVPQAVAPSVPTDLPRSINSIPVGNPGPRDLGNRDGKRPRIFDLSSLDNPPKAKFQISPPYPHALKVAGLKGEVLVEFVVDETGHVINPRIVSSSHPDFEETTLRAIRQWRFEPGKRDGRAVRFRMSVPVVFSVTDGN